MAARDQLNNEHTAAINALTAVLRVVDLSIDVRKNTDQQIVEVSCWRARVEGIGTATARSETIRLAKHVTARKEDLTHDTKTVTERLHQTPAQTLLGEPGIGPVTAAVAMTAWPHLGRLRSKSAFVCLAGGNPIPASSGNTVRHRLNRGGDRRLNQALHMAVIVRMHPETRAYIERRTAEGHTTNEISRCLKQCPRPSDPPHTQPASPKRPT